MAWNAKVQSVDDNSIFMVGIKEGCDLNEFINTAAENHLTVLGYKFI